MSQRRISGRILVLLHLLVPALLPSVAWAQITAYAVVPNYNDDTVSVIDTRTEVVLGAAIPVKPRPNAVAMSSDGRRAYVSHFGDATLTVIDVVGHKKEAEIALAATSRAAAVSPDNRWVYLIHAGTDTMSVVSAEGLVVMPFSVTVGNDPTCIAITPNGQYAYIGNFVDMTVSVVRLTLPNPTVVTTIPLTMWPVDITMAPDGRTAFVLLRLGVFNGAIVPIDLATNTLGAPIGTNPPWHVALTYDGTLLYSVGTGFSTAAQVYDAATGAGVGSIPLSNGLGVAATPNGNWVYVTDPIASTVEIIDRWTQTLIGRSIGVGSGAGDLAIGPSVIVQTAAPAIPVSIARDSDLTALDFGSFVPFNGGTLKTTGLWTTSRTVSLLQAGGTIETRAAQAILDASTSGPGLLTKTGPGVLVLNAPSRHWRSLVKEGALSVMSLHFGDVVVNGGTLSGSGALGHVTGTRGTIAPGGTAGPGTLHASTVTMSAAMTFAVTMVGAAEGSYSRLETTTSLDLGNALLTVNARFTPRPGQSFTIVTNAIGEFANYREGDVVFTPRGSFFLSYQGGPLGQDVVLTAW